MQKHAVALMQNSSNAIKIKGFSSGFFGGLRADHGLQSCVAS